VNFSRKPLNLRQRYKAFNFYGRVRDRAAINLGEKNVRRNTASHSSYFPAGRRTSCVALQPKLGISRLWRFRNNIACHFGIGNFWKNIISLYSDYRIFRVGERISLVPRRLLFGLDRIIILSLGLCRSIVGRLSDAVKVVKEGL